MKLNNKGFTLIELLAVIVILVTILMIAIPSITSSLERSKTKQLDAKKKLLESIADIYVGDNRNKITTKPCYITIDELYNKGYATLQETQDPDGSKILGYIIYDGNNLTFQNATSNVQCVR